VCIGLLVSLVYCAVYVITWAHGWYTTSTKTQVLRKLEPLGHCWNLGGALKLFKRWVGGRAGTAVPQGAVCELPNPPSFPLT
jgi:hypothetical protein